MKLVRKNMYHVNFKSRLLDIERIVRAHNKTAKIYYKVTIPGAPGYYNKVLTLNNFIVYGNFLEYRAGDNWEKIALNNIYWVYMGGVKI